MARFFQFFLVVGGLSLAGLGVVVGFGLLWFGVVVYYTQGLHQAASFARAVSHYQPHLPLYIGLAVFVGLVLHGIGMLYEPPEQ